MGGRAIRSSSLRKRGDPAPCGAGSGSRRLRLLGARPCAHQGIAQVVLVPGGYFSVQPGRLGLVALPFLRDGRVEEIVRTLRVGLGEVSQGLVIVALLELEHAEDALKG